MDRLVLGYWAIRGRGSVPRMLLEYTGTPYEEKRYSDFKDWFGADKLNFKGEFPNLPYIIDGANRITETRAVVNYICN